MSTRKKSIKCWNITINVGGVNALERISAGFSPPHSVPVLLDSPTYDGR